MLRAAFTFALLSTIPLAAQDADSGISVPMTLSGAGLYTHRMQLDEANAPPVGGGFRVMLYPTVQLGSNWFGYAAVQIRSTPYFYYDAFEADHDLYTDALQAFIGYHFRRDQISMVIKAGKLSSAFGAFPLHYDDAENPLLDQPLSYITDLPLSPGYLPYGTTDLRGQYYGSGLPPVTLYGLPGVQADLSAGRFDGRFQLTSGSPVNPKNLTDAGQYLQWTAGGGYTIHQGFRVGASGFRGPYLDQSVAPWLPYGTNVRNFPASGLGGDVQWAKGRWSASGEVQRFVFDLPGFQVSPSVTSGYVEMKRVITPRLYLAGRAGFLYAGRVVDSIGVSASQWAPYLDVSELAAGFWVSHNQLLKGGYEWMLSQGGSGTRTNVLGVEYVLTLHSLAWAFR